MGAVEIGPLRRRYPLERTVEAGLEPHPKLAL
jgi:hypothetical protein